MKKFLFFALLAAVFLINPHVSSAETLSYIPDNPEKALIIIHGYGQNGARMQGMTNSLKKDLPDTAFYYPTAPDRAPASRVPVVCHSCVWCGNVGDETVPAYACGCGGQRGCFARFG